MIRARFVPIATVTMAVLLGLVRVAGRERVQAGQAWRRRLRQKQANATAARQGKRGQACPNRRAEAETRRQRMPQGEQPKQAALTPTKHAKPVPMPRVKPGTPRRGPGRSGRGRRQSRPWCWPPRPPTPASHSRCPMPRRASPRRSPTRRPPRRPARTSTPSRRRSPSSAREKPEPPSSARRVSATRPRRSWWNG